ncbi:MAG: AsmA family protein [Gammaproteobacteria bacterium]
MSRLLKWIFLALAAIGLLGVLIAVAVYTLVDPQQYRAIAIEAVQRTTGRTLTLDGEVKLKLFPCCAVQVDTATLGNPADFEGEPFLRVASAQLAIRLWPLLTRREVEIGTVELDGLQVNLLGRADGSNNWTFTGPAEAQSTPPPAAGDTSLSSFSVAGIRISNGTLNYQDAADDSRYRIEGLDLKTGPIANAAPFDLEAAFTGHDLKDNSGGKLRLKARITLATDANATSVTLADLQADADLRGIGGLDSLSGNFGSPAMMVRLADDTQVSAAELSTDLKLTTPELPDQTIPLKAALTGLRYDVDVDGGTLGGLTATASVAGVELKVNVDQPATFGAHNNLRGILQFAEVSPRDVLARLKEPVPVTADQNVLKRLSGKANWFLTDTDVGLEKMTFVLDDSRISGSVSRQIPAEGSKAVPRTRFDLSVDAINADRTWSPPAKHLRRPKRLTAHPLLCGWRQCHRNSCGDNS